MDDSNVGVKDERDDGGSVPPADRAPVAEKPKADDEENVAPAVTAETKAPPSTDDGPPAVATSEEDAVGRNSGPETDSVAVESDRLIEAMSAATISAADDADETRRNGVVVAAAAEEKVVHDGSDASVKASEAIEEAAVVGGADGAREFVEEIEENRIVEKEEEDRVKSQESVPDGEGNSVEEPVQDGEEENKDPDAPVPVDDDTNDPQYIPRRGRFYEHDDRMAYSTTSSECSESDYEDDSDENNEDRSLRRRHVGSKKHIKPVTPVETDENNSSSVAPAEIAESISSSKKVLAISKVVSTVVNPSNTTSELVKKPGFGSKKSRNVDSLDKWSHDMYNEQEQAPKSKDELLASYGYDIREESEAPRARRHHKYGRAATTKYTRSWQDTRAYSSNTSGGQQSNKIKRSLNKNKNKLPTSDEYTSEFPSLDDKSKPSVSSVETQKAEPCKQLKSPEKEEKKAFVPATGPSRLQEPASQNPTKPKTPSNHDSHLDQQNGGSHLPSHYKNYFNRPSSDYPTVPDKYSQNSQAPPPSASSNFYNRQQNSDRGPPNNFKPAYFNNSQGNPRHQHSSAPRNRHFQQNHNSPQQFNRDRYFSKGSGPNQQHFDQSCHNNMSSVTAGTGRTQHGQYHRHFESNNGPTVPIQTPIVRSSKRYSVQSRRELPDPVLNFGNISKTQQQNGLVVQDQPQPAMQQIQSQQMQTSPQVLQQQATLQMHQQQPIQLQQYHQPIQQLHPHHSMVLDHNTGMMVMADPSMYHQIYATTQYSTAVPPGSTPGGNVDDPNTAAAASALQMLATQAAVYQPVPTGVASPSNTQPESFMTTYYQPLQQPTQQPPPRRVNLAIPIVAPPVSNQQQNTPKSNTSSTN